MAIQPLCTGSRSQTSLMNIKLLRNILNCVPRRRFVSITVVGGPVWEWCSRAGGIIRGTDPPTCRVTERNIRHAL